MNFTQIIEEHTDPNTEEIFFNDLHDTVHQKLIEALNPLLRESGEILRPVDYDDSRLSSDQREKVRYIEGQIEGIHKAAEALGIELYSDQQPNV